MTPSAYQKKFLRPYVLSYAAAGAALKHLHHKLEVIDVVEILRHPAFERIIEYQIVKCSDVWVLLGKAVLEPDECMNHISDLKKEANFEVALSLDKAKLMIWRDLHCT